MCSVIRWRFLLGQWKLCDHGRKLVSESVSGNGFIETYLIFYAVIVPLDEDQLFRYSG